MKLFIAAVAITVISISTVSNAEEASNPCIICPDGATDPDFEVSVGEDGIVTTCQDLIDDSKLIESDDVMCEINELYEVLCCYTPPEAENPCTVCPDGIVHEEDESPESLYQICMQSIESAKMFDAIAESETCELMMGYELSCCPTPSENPCILCPNGLGVEEDYIPFKPDPDADDAVPADTCKSIVGNAKFYDADDELCELMLYNELYCCPTPPENPCSICPNGIDADKVDYVPFGDDQDTDDAAEESPTSCQYLVEQAKMWDTDDGMCEMAKPEYERYCCPQPAENPCTLCADGIINDLPDSLHMECEQIVDFLTTYEVDSDTCEQSKPSAVSCCPTPVTNPCPVCPDGLAVNEDYVPWPKDSITCGQILQMAQAVDAESEMCLELFEDEDMDEFPCCPKATTVQASPTTAAPQESTDSTGATSTTDATTPVPETTNVASTGTSTTAASESTETTAAPETTEPASSNATTTVTEGTTPAPNSTATVPADTLPEPTSASTTAATTSSTTSSTQAPDAPTEPFSAGSFGSCFGGFAVFATMMYAFAI